MKHVKFGVSLLLAFGSISGVGLAADGVLTKAQYIPGTYCHRKFPAMQEKTLGEEQPVLKDASAGDMIDYYGPCDESPTGTNQIDEQKLDESHKG